jgi:hypothetical protein
LNFLGPPPVQARASMEYIAASITPARPQSRLTCFPLDFLSLTLKILLYFALALAYI